MTSSGRRGVLLAFEGIDGAGKSTQADRLADSLRSAGLDVVRSKEPTDGPHGRRLRDSAMTGRLPLEEEIDTFIADRKEHVANLIEPGLAAGRVIVLDRYFYSTIAYQGVRGADTAKLEADQAFAPVPDIVFFIDIGADLGIARISEGRGETPNEFEKQAALDAIRNEFMRLAARRPEMKKLDGSVSEDELARQILTCFVEGPLKRVTCPAGDQCAGPSCPHRSTGECDWARVRDKLLSASSS